MKKILYIISKPPEADLENLLSSPISPTQSVSAILIQKGITFTPPPSISSFVLTDDVPSDNGTVPYSKIQYSDMLRMIMEADTVISI